MDYFDYDEDPEAFDVDAFLEASQENERERLEDELAKIDQQLEERDQLHDEIIEELEGKLEWYVERLETLYRRVVGKQDEREQLKARIEAFYEDLREERRARWRDRQELEMERREVLRALEEVDDDAFIDLL